MADLHVVILAAGKGTRMRSSLPKVLHEVAGRPMIEYPLRAAMALAPTILTIVVGHMAELVRRTLARYPGLQFAVQEPQLGTGHALLQAEPFLRDASGTLLVLAGDVPFLRSETLEALVEHHERAAATATVLTAGLDDPAGYGRIVREGGWIAKIVEHRDASPEELAIREVNSGVYAFDLASLFPSLRRVAAENAQGEYYLPDLVAIYAGQHRRVETMHVDNADEIRGINSHAELAEVSRIVRNRKHDELMGAGVSIQDPSATYIGADVEVGAETTIYPGVHLEGRTRIGSRCVIHAGVRIVDSTLGDRVTVNNFCVIVRSTVAAGARVGPFAHLRPETSVGEEAQVGNFVELKNTRLGTRSKANHLTYLGDATIGERVNVGAGTITCNYDGVRKHPTVIEDEAFIGSDTQLVAPVRVGRGAYVAAGSSITADVPAGSLGIARGRQVNVEGWVERKKAGDKGLP